LTVCISASSFMPHLYDRLVPYLSLPRRVVTFDFLGWGASDKPADYPYAAKNQEGDLDVVIKQLNLGHVVLVAHDASGPPAIDWALRHPDQMAALVLLNTYYIAVFGERRVPLSLQNLQHGLLNESVQRSRNAKLAHSASVRLGDFHPPHRFRCVGPA